MRARPQGRKTGALFAPRRRRARRVLAADTIALGGGANAKARRISCDGRAFRLREAINITVRRRGPYYFAAYEPLDIVGYGRNRERALASFADVFSATWDWIAVARDSELGEEARELKRKLRDLVAAVESG